MPLFGKPRYPLNAPDNVQPEVPSTRQQPKPLSLLAIKDAAIKTISAWWKG
jgi:hypothetical protein